MKRSAENSRKISNADFSVAKKWDCMRTGREILPDGEFCGFSIVLRGANKGAIPQTRSGEDQRRI